MKKILLTIFSIMLGISIFSGCGGGAADKFGSTNGYTIAKDAGYYKDLVLMPNGEFLVKDKISEADAASGGVVYKVDLNDNKAVEKVTSMYAGSAINTEWRDIQNRKFNAACITLEYQDGYIKYNFKNSRMNATKGYCGAYSIRYKIDEQNNRKIAYLYNKKSEQAVNESGYSQLLFTYDDKGNLSKVAYANSNGDRVVTSHRDYETRFKYSEGSIHPSEVANYGKDDALMVNEYGVAKTAYAFDDKGRLKEARHFGSDEALREKNMPEPKVDVAFDSISAGAITKYSYEGDNIRPSRISFYGKDEQPLAIKAWGSMASFVIKYNEHNMISSVSALAPDDTPVAIDAKVLGSNVVEVRCGYDDTGNVNRFTMFGKDGNMIVSDVLKCAEVRMTYDDKRRLSETAYYGTGEDQIDAFTDGHYAHRKTNEYNDDDEIVATIYYNKANAEVFKRVSNKIEPAAAANNAGTSTGVSASNNASAPAPTAVGYITGSEVRMRANPGSNGSVLGFFNKGERVDILGSSPGWIQVRRSNGAVGWVSDKFCSVK